MLRAFSAAVQIYWNKRNFSQSRKKVKLTQGWLRTPTWPEDLR